MDQTGTQQSAGLAEFGAVLRKRWQASIIILVSVLVTALLYEANKPIHYKSYVDIAVFPLALSHQLLNAAPEVTHKSGDAELPFFTDHVYSEECIGAVIRSGLLGSVPPPNSLRWQELTDDLIEKVEVARLEKRNIIRITVRNEDQELAPKIADAFGEAYVTSISRFMTTAPRKIEQILDQEIAKVELELARYREVVDHLKKQKEATGTLKEFNVANAQLDEFRRVLAERLTVLQRLEFEAARGKFASLEAYDEAFDGVFSAIPGDMSQRLGGDARTRVMDAHGRWVEQRDKIRRLSRTFTPQHPEFAQAISSALGVADDVQRAMQDWIRAIERQIGEQIDHSRRMATASDPGIATLIDGRPIEYDEQALQRYEIELTIRQGLLQKLVEKKSEVGIQNSQAGELAEWIRPALKPAVLHGPNIERAAAMGLSLGLLVACVAAFVLESLDRSLRHPDYAEARLRKNVLAVLPRLPEVPPRPEGYLFNRIAAVVAPDSPSSEAYIGLAHKLLRTEDRLIAVTSTGPQEGKSTTSVNLAAALAKLGRNVLLVSANLRRPTAHLFFGIPESPGVRDLVERNLDIGTLVKKTCVPNLTVLPSGARGSQAVAATLTSSHFVESLKTARELYDFVLIDLPPTGPVSDAMALAPHVDGIYLVYMVGKAHEEAVVNVIRSLEEAGGKVKGVIMNDVLDYGRKYGYGYGYRYGYRYAGAEQT